MPKSSSGGMGLEAVGQALRAAQRVVVVGHVTADADCLASMLALASSVGGQAGKTGAIELPGRRTRSSERDSIARFTELRTLMGSWRFLHRWLAIVMLMLAAVHIALAVLFGDLWIVERWR